MPEIKLYECECKGKSCAGFKRFHCIDGKPGLKGKELELPQYVKSLIDVAKAVSK